MSLPAGENQVLNIVIQTAIDANTLPPLTESENLWLESIVDGEGCKNQHEVIRQARRSKIEKVPWMLREVEENSKCYDPIMVSIGPYHHGKSELILMEQHKLTMARNYVNGDLKMLQTLYAKVMHLAEDARKCYTDETSTTSFNDKEFIRMIFLDGCFILQFIYCIVSNKRHELKMKNNIIAIVQRDLFLLENQIPFQVLKELSYKFGDENEKKKMFSEFIAQIRGLPPRAEGSCKKRIKKLACKLPIRGKGARRDEKGINSELEDEPAHLLDLLRTHLFDKSVLTKAPPSKCCDWYSYRSAKELKAVGIHFRPSETNRFTDVEFKSRFLAGILKLPPICIDDSTKSRLLNMVAYEACPDGPDDFGVSSYICLMDSLIDHAEDVKELRSKGILLNFLGSDQQVAELFNQIADNLVQHPYAYAVVKDRIEKHYKNKLKIWVAEWLHTHFTSPWTVLAFIGAILALFLSVIQTYESLYPGKK